MTSTGTALIFPLFTYPKSLASTDGIFLNLQILRGSHHLFIPVLDKLIKHENIINFARAQRLGWYGHIERMQDTRMVKAVHGWKPISKRAMGKPKIRWEDDVKKEIQRLKLYWGRAKTT